MAQPPQCHSKTKYKNNFELKMVVVYTSQADVSLFANRQGKTLIIEHDRTIRLICKKMSGLIFTYFYCNEVWSLIPTKSSGVAKTIHLSKTNLCSCSCLCCRRCGKRQQRAWNPPFLATAAWSCTAATTCVKGTSSRDSLQTMYYTSTCLLTIDLATIIYSLHRLKKLKCEGLGIQK